MTITIGQIAAMINGEVIGEKNISIFGPSKIEEGKEGTITFLANPKYESYIYTSKASAVIVSKDFVPKEKLSLSLIKVDNVSASLQLLMENFDQTPEMEKVDKENVSIHKTAKLMEGVHIGEFSFVGKNAQIGEGTIIYPQVFIGDDVIVGDNCIIYPGVRLMKQTVIGANCIIHSNCVIGSDGFGFTKDKSGAFKKIPQLGNVIVEDDVEMGGSCVIDRATMGSTIIRRGVKLDNLVHIAHNVEIGTNAAIAGQCGIAGSAKIGKDCMMGGQVGVAGHISVADGTQVQAKSGIAGAVKKKNSKLYGYPAIDYGDYLRSYAGFKQLPSLLKRIQELEKKLGK